MFQNTNFFFSAVFARVKQLFLFPRFLFIFFFLNYINPHHDEKNKNTKKSQNIANQ